LRYQLRTGDPDEVDLRLACLSEEYADVPLRHE